MLNIHFILLLHREQFSCHDLWECIGSTHDIGFSQQIYMSQLLDLPKPTKKLGCSNFQFLFKFGIRETQ